MYLLYMTAKYKLLIFATLILAATVACKRQGQDASTTQPATTAAPPIEVPADTIEVRITKRF
jgi:hypothetical protein